MEEQGGGEHKWMKEVEGGWDGRGGQWRRFGEGKEVDEKAYGRI